MSTWERFRGLKPPRSAWGFFISWVYRVNDGTREFVEPLRNYTSVYLIPVLEEDGDGLLVANPFLLRIFEDQLRAWHQDVSTWPPMRDLTAFYEWFYVEMEALVVDLAEEELCRKEV